MWIRNANQIGDGSSVRAKKQETSVSRWYCLDDDLIVDSRGRLIIFDDFPTIPRRQRVVHFCVDVFSDCTN